MNDEREAKGERDRVIDELAAKYRLDRNALCEAIDWVGMAYDGIRSWAGTEVDDHEPDTLDKLELPLGRICDLLLPLGVDQIAADRNFHRLAVALANPNRETGWSRELSAGAAWPEALEEIGAELNRLITRLVSIQIVVREIHKAPQRGRKFKTRELREAVHILAAFWESSGPPFTIDWLREGKEWKPVSDAACFVHKAMALITEPQRLSQLKKVTERVRNERNPKLRPKAPK